MRQVLLGLFLAVGFVFAQMFPIVPGEAVAHYKPQNGAWTEYRMKDNDSDGTMKISVVGDEERNGQHFFWWEIKTVDKKSGDRSIIKFEGSENPNNKDVVSTVIIQQNDEQPIKYTFKVPKSDENKKEDKPKPATPAASDTDEDNEAIKNLGWETITVPAGTFKCQHFVIYGEDDKETDEYWTSDKLPLIPVVKALNHSDNSTMELVSYGDKAVSEIKGIPKEITMDRDYFDNMMFNVAKEETKNAAKKSASDALKEGMKEGLKGLFGH